MDEIKLQSAVKSRETEIIGKRFYSQLSATKYVFWAVGISHFLPAENAESFRVGDFDFCGLGKFKLFFLGEKQISDVLVFITSSYRISLGNGRRLKPIFKYK